VPQATQGVIQNINNATFNKAFCFGSISGHAANAIAFAALQEIDISHTFSMVELKGPEALSPLGVGISEETVTGTFSFGVAVPEQFVMALGGSMAYNAGTDTTTYTKLVNQEPLPFNMQCVSDGGSTPNITLNLYNCLSSSWKIFKGGNRQWNIGDGAFRVYGQSNGGSLFDWSMPGQQTNSS
jgi:hypothetical protein